MQFYSKYNETKIAKQIASAFSKLWAWQAKDTYFMLFFKVYNFAKFC